MYLYVEYNNGANPFLLLQATRETVENNIRQQIASNRDNISKMRCGISFFSEECAEDATNRN